MDRNTRVTLSICHQFWISNYLWKHNSDILCISVCAFGLYEDGITCSPCLKLISGSGGEMLIDRDISTYSLVPFQTNVTVAIYYALAVHGNCSRSRITLRAAVDISTSCNDIRDAVFTEKQDSGCSGVRTHFGICDVINENLSHGTRICRMRCQCADSADQCLIHILSGVTPEDMNIYEIMADKSNQN